MFSPLEQFEVRSFYSFYFFCIDFSFTLVVLYLLFISLSIYFLFILLRGWTFVVPLLGQTLSEILYRFVYSILSQQIVGKYGKEFFPFIFNTFLFVLFANIIGLLGLSYTVTSHIAVTLGLAASINIGLGIIGFFLYNFGFLKLFVPGGISIFLLPLLISVEIFSYLLRTVSLSVRLFVNMMAGHSLVFIFANFTVIFLFLGGIFTILAFVPYFLLLLIFVLEIGIAFLQSYVFVLLMCIYMNDSYNPGH